MKFKKMSGIMTVEIIKRKRDKIPNMSSHFIYSIKSVKIIKRKRDKIQNMSNHFIHSIESTHQLTFLIDWVSSHCVSRYHIIVLFHPTICHGATVFNFIPYHSIT